MTGPLFSRRFFLLASVAAIVSVALLIAGAGYVIQKGRETDQKQCESAKDGRDTFRAVLVFFRQTSIERAAPAERDRIVDFWDAVLKLAPPIECVASGNPEPTTTGG